jgi:lysophospholipid acyltransferase (LPLAT)-like uncharacterized protein
MTRPAAHRWKLALAPAGWRVLAATIRVNRCAPVPAGEPGPVIFACLHRDIIPAILHVRPARPYLLISASPDGDILVRCLRDAGYRFVRGATRENGSRAFVRLLRCLRDGYHLGLAVDGPRGPFGTIHDGVLQLARRSGAPILPLVAAAPRARILATWDRTVVPYPFSAVTVSGGPVQRVPPEAGDEWLEGVRGRLATFFGTTTAKGR